MSDYFDYNVFGDGMKAQLDGAESCYLGFVSLAEKCTQNGGGRYNIIFKLIEVVNAQSQTS